MHTLVYWCYTAYKIYTEIYTEIKEYYVSWDLFNIVPPKCGNHWMQKLVEAATVLPTSRFHISVLQKPSPVSQIDVITTTKNWEKGLTQCPFTQRLGNTQKRSSPKLELWPVKQCGRQPSCNPQPGRAGRKQLCRENEVEQPKDSTPRTATDPSTPSSPWGPAAFQLQGSMGHSNFFFNWASGHVGTFWCPLQLDAFPGGSMDLTDEPWAYYTLPFPSTLGLFFRFAITYTIILQALAQADFCNN